MLKYAKLAYINSKVERFGEPRKDLLLLYLILVESVSVVCLNGPPDLDTFQPRTLEFGEILRLRITQNFSYTEIYLYKFPEIFSMNLYFIFINLYSIW